MGSCSISIGGIELIINFKKFLTGHGRGDIVIRLMTKKDFSITILSIRVDMIVKEKSFTYKSRLK